MKASKRPHAIAQGKPCGAGGGAGRSLGNGDFVCDSKPQGGDMINGTRVAPLGLLLLFFCLLLPGLRRMLPNIDPLCRCAGIC